MIYLELFYTFFTIGLFTFGGGYAMLPLIQQKVVENGWLSLEEIVDFVAVSESTPGPFAVNTATYVGTETAGIFGAICATLGVVLPSFIIILIVARFYEKYKQSRIVKGCMSGLKPAVVGLIGAAILSVVAEVLFPAGLTIAALGNPAMYVSLGIFALTVTLAFWKKVHPIWLILISAVLGIAWGHLSPLFL